MRQLLPLLLVGCATVPKPAPPTFEDVIANDDTRVMWVAAHPDDEAMAGPILARACVGRSRACLMAVMNRGGGGECLRPEGCKPDLASVRGTELLHAANALGAELVQYDYFNASLPMSSFPSRQELAQRWIADGDPAARLTEVIRRFKPTVVITFEPTNGFTGHPEHQLASRFATEAVRRAAKGANAHRVEHVYYFLNRYWFFRAAGAGDPVEPTELFDAHVPCGAPGRTCLDVALAITRAHRSQSGDMGRIRSLRPQFGVQFLRRIDPYDELEAPSPLE